MSKQMRKRKMATKWSSLPSIIIVDILSYLDLSERLNASTTCKRWRGCVLHPKLWRNIDLNLKIHSKRKSSVTDVSSRFAREIWFNFHARNPVFVREFIDLLSSSSNNASLEGLHLHPSSFRVEWPERMHKDGMEL